MRSTTMRNVIRALALEGVLGWPVGAYAAGPALRGISSARHEHSLPALARMRNALRGQRPLRHLLERAFAPANPSLDRNGPAYRVVEALNEGDLTRIMDLYAANVRIENPSSWPFTSTDASAVDGIDDLLDHISATFQRDPHLRLTLLDAAVFEGGIRLSYRTNRLSWVVTEHLSLDEAGKIAHASCSQSRRSLQ